MHAYYCSSNLSVVCIIYFYVLSLGTCNITTTTTEKSIPPKFDILGSDCNVQDRVTLDSCLYQILERVRPLLPTGIPELKVPALEPLHISNVTFIQEGGIAEIQADFTELQVKGLSNYITVFSRSDPKRFRFTLGLRFPYLHVKGIYNVTGNIFLLPILGQGPFWMELHNVKAKVYNWLNVVDVAEENISTPVPDDNLVLKENTTLANSSSGTEVSASKGLQNLRLMKTRTDFKFGRCKVYLDNMFHGDEVLGETVNTFLNNNAKDVVEEFRPQITEKIDQLIQIVFGEAITQIPLVDWMTAVRIKDIASGEEVDVTILTA